MNLSRLKSIFHIFIFFAILASLLGSPIFVTPAHASGIVVDSMADTIADDGTCTLREAITNANTDTQLSATTGECATGSSTDSISFDSSLAGTIIHLASTLLISSDMTIDGSSLSSQISISGDNSVQVLSVNSGTVTLNSLIIMQGSVSAAPGGGGIYNATGATLTINNSTIAENAAAGTPGGGGIYNASGATLTINNSTISDNTNTSGPGGGIRNDGTLTVTNSTFSDNTASGGSGGGIRNIGTLTVANSTFSNNITSGSGGGIYNVADFVSATVTNSTFSGNSAGSAGGGIYYSTGTGTFNYANTIIANSTSGGDCAGDGTLGTNTNNLVENGGCSASLQVDPALDALANNSGPTQTFALIAGSPAIDAGDVTTCTNFPISNLDQRGVTRPVGAQCDIGAYEGSIPDVVAPSVTAFTATSPTSSLNIPITSFTASDNVSVTAYLISQTNTQPAANDSGWGSLPSTYTVGSLGDYTLYPWAKDAADNVSAVYGSPAAVTVCYPSVTVTSNADSGAGTLRQAIADTCAGGTITFYTALSGTTIHLASTLTLSKNVTIDGSALAGQIMISGDNAVRVFFVNSGVTATLNSLAITKGNDFSGGGIRNDGTLTITNSTLSDNSATSGGGGIFNNGSRTLTITNSTLSNNSAANGGGGIHNQGTLTITNSTLSGNSAASSPSNLGGGIYNNGGTLNFANTIIANSTTGGDCVNGGTSAINTNLNNLIEDSSNACGLTNGVNGNIIGTDPNLDILADNGGITQTFALLTGSPAINAGDNTTCAAAPVNNLDQRSVSRPQGGQCDIGAYEYVATVTSNADSGPGTLRQAIADVASGDTIIFDSDLSGATIHLASTLNIVQNMTIDGSALASKITVSGDDAVRVFYIHSGMTVTLDSLIITRGNGTDPNTEDNTTTGGGGIQNNTGFVTDQALTVKNSIISGNTATGNGGGILNTNNSPLTITNSTISGNTATSNGGGIYSDGPLTVTSSTISGNAATGGDGGGLRDGGVTTLTNSTFSGNSASGSGGAIYNDGNLTAKNSTLSGNSASVSGGGLFGNTLLNYTNTIIANSTGGDCSSDVNTNLNNLVEDGSCSGNHVNFVTGDPMLDVLADNGGPTQTLALFVGSSAIDAGDDSTCTSSPVNSLDQRGVTRPVGAHCDIGAYEGAKDITPPTVLTFSATSPSTSLNIPIPALSFTASDDVAVTGYKITETSTQPLAADAGWTASAPSTYTVSGDNTYTLYPWVKDAAGNVSALFGSPVNVIVDTTPPTVSSITLVNPSTTAKTTVQFLVTFSEAVTGIATADFTLVKTGSITGQSVTSVSGSGTTRTVTVKTGSGDGTLKLRIPNTATISDMHGNALSALPFTSVQAYTVKKTLTYTSASLLDGWMLESTETSNVGGTLNTADTTFLLGDAAADKQYRSILSFDTTTIPDNATIKSITLKIKRPATGYLIGNNNPFTWGLGLKADLCKFFFGTTSALQLNDFNYNQTTNCTLLAATFGSTPTANWYSANVLSTAFAKVNKTGLTQFRLRFALDDNDDKQADYLKFYSGNTTTAADRPQLVITYSVP